MKKNRMEQTARILDKLLMVFQWLNLTLGILVIGGMVISGVAFLLGNVTVAEVVEVKLGNVVLQMKNSGRKDNVNLWYGMFLTVEVIACMSVLYISCRLIRKILKLIINKSPFSKEVSVNFKRLGYLTLGYGLYHNIEELIGAKLQFEYYNLYHLADSEYVISVGRSFEFDSRFLILFLVLMLVSYIFSYGTELQQLSDETV